LWGVDNGGHTIEHVVNNVGDPIGRGDNFYHQASYVCTYSNKTATFESDYEPKFL